VSETSSETTKVEKPVTERGGYSAGDLDVADFPPPPESMTVHVSDRDQGTATEDDRVTTLPDSSDKPGKS
jgi:hypothetical protein